MSVVLAPSHAHQAATEVARMSLVDALDLGAEVWQRLEADALAPSPFMSWAWHRACADADPAAAAVCETLVLRVGGGRDVTAILPLHSGPSRFHRVPVRALTWAIGDLGCPDHLDLLAARTADVPALVPTLESLDWEILVLTNLASDGGGALVSRLCEALSARGHRVQRDALWPCPYLDLPGDWEEYLASVTARRRQALRYMDRSLRRRHAVTITDYNGDRVTEGWDRLVALHERRWATDGGAGAFRDPRVDRLHRRFTAELSARGQLWLTSLDLDGEPAAAWYGLTCGDTVYFYQSGRDPKWERESVGQVLIAAMIRRAMERGFKRFDFLRGEDPYKRQWTTTARTTEEVTVFRRGWRGRWLRGVDAVAKRLRP